jgi:polyhydroxyalkanoate synthesis regulator phasin
MSNLIGKSINMGLGLFALSREKIEEFVEELVDKGEVARKDARDLALELIKKGEEQRNELKELIKNEVTEAINFAGLAKKEDIITRDEISKIVKEQVTQVLLEQGIIKDKNAK